MPMQVELKTEGLNTATQAVLGLPGIFARARKSALSVTGNMVRTELRNHVEYGGTGWKPLHPITLRLRKYRSAPGSPLFYLGKFARYLVDKEGTVLEVGFGKSHKGEPGDIDDPWLTAAAGRAEHGQTVRVTKKTRMAWLATKKKVRGKRDTRSGAVMRSYFALKAGTTSLTIPRRPIFSAVFRKIQPMVISFFEGKFWAAVQRYRMGGAKTSDNA